MKCKHEVIEEDIDCIEFYHNSKLNSIFQVIRDKFSGYAVNFNLNKSPSIVIVGAFVFNIKINPGPMKHLKNVLLKRLN